MKKTIVKFASVKFDRFDADATLPAKFSRLLNSVPLSEMVKGRTVAIKMHLGGNLGYTTVHPLFVRILIDALKNAGGRVFVTDVCYMENDNFWCARGKIQGLHGGYIRSPDLPGDWCL
jgi:uncharacterized Fe-S center protein